MRLNVHGCIAKAQFEPEIVIYIYMKVKLHPTKIGGKNVISARDAEMCTIAKAK